MKKPQQHKKRKSNEKNEKKGPQPKPPEENEKPFDFGGLPERDLKKNLGCG